MKSSDGSASMFCLGLLPEHERILECLRAQDGPYQIEAEVLSSGLRAAVAVASIPFTMAQDAVESLKFQQLHTSERIRARNLDGLPEDERERIALDKARERLQAELVDVEVFNSHIEGIVTRLNAFLAKLGDGVAQLNSETLVMLWGVFEVFATDVIRKRLNLHPDEAVRLACEEPAKKRLNLRNVPFGGLSDFGFDLSERMGDLVLEYTNFSSLEALKDIVSVLFPLDNDLRQAMGASEMRRLWKRRNLVAHRRGIVDRAYQAAEVDDVSFGDRIVVRRADIEASLDAVLKASQAMLAALREAEGPVQKS